MVRWALDKSFRLVSDLGIALGISVVMFGLIACLGMLVIGNPFQVQLQTILFVASLLAVLIGLVSFISLATGRLIPVRKILVDYLRYTP